LCPESKEDRTHVHQWIRKNLKGFSSETSEDKQFLQVTYKKDSKNLKRVQKESSFLHFTLEKHNMDTYSAITQLSKVLYK